MSHQLLMRMMEKYDTDREDLAQMLEDYDDLVDEYGEGIKLLGQFEHDALEEIAEDHMTHNQQ